MWADSAGQWRCFLDRCPHRMATLSDGFIDKKRDEVCVGWDGERGAQGKGRREGGSV